jgi:protein gp37
MKRIDQDGSYRFADANVSQPSLFRFDDPEQYARLMHRHFEGRQSPLLWDADAQKRGMRSQVFCASMADVFDEEAPVGQLARLWNLIRLTPNLDWQLLTKRPHRISQCLPHDWENGYHNVWLGTSVEDQRVISRIAHLTKIPAIVRFLSIEPLLGPIPNLPLEGIDWIIVGGESGPHARPVQPQWIFEIRRQCRAAGVAFFFKQWGGVNKKRAGRVLSGRIYNEMPKIRHLSPSSVHQVRAQLT